MFKKTTICAGLAFAFGASALVSMPAFAQETKKVERVEVTGTRIISPNADSPAPIQVLTAADIAASGVANVQDLLQKNPAFGPAAISRNNSNFSTSSAGVAAIDLRGLGSDRTLVLVNGRRYVSGIPGSQTVDLNTIPAEFIERIEVLTGGASASYGSDAIAGVVNIILKKTVEGVFMDAQWGRSAKGDDDKKKASITFGAKTADGRGNIMSHLAVTKQGAVYSRDRDISAVDQASEGAFFSGAAEDMFKARRPYYSSFAPQGRFFAGGQNFTFDSTGKAVPFSTNGPAGDGVGATGFNRSEFRTIAIPTDRTLVASKGDFQYAEGHSIYFEGMYASTSVKTRIEPFPLDSVNIVKGKNGLIPAEFLVNGVKMRNPMVPDYLFNLATDRDGDGLKDYNFTRRMSDIGNRAFVADRDTFRFVGGLKGELSSTWSYNIYGSYGSNKEAQNGQGQVNILNFNNALEAIPDVDDVNGNGNRTEAICRDVNARAQGCVPANIFGANTLSAAAAKYIAAPSSLSTKATQKIVSGSVTGEAFTLPYGAVNVAAGMEWREEYSSTSFDALTQAGLNAGNALPNTEGKFSVREFFVEAQVPLLKNVPFVKSLDANLAMRQGNYSTVGSVNSWNAGLDWAVNPDVRIRATSAKSTRAPNVGELYAAPAQDFPTGINDPCSGIKSSDTSAKAVACRQDVGVMNNLAANGGVFTLNQADAQGISGYNSGNPNLKAEKGQSTTIGLVVTPKSISLLKDFAFSVDYYNIKIKEAIGNPGRQFILDQCYGGGDTSFCKFVVRRKLTAGSNSPGSLEFINLVQENSGGLETAGLDLTANYSTKLAGGQFRAQGSWTRLTKYDYTPRPGADVDSSLGEVGFAKNKFVLSLGYNIDKMSFVATTSTIGRSSLDDGFLKGYDLAPGSVSVGSRTYLDMQAAYKFGRTQIYFGIDNATNTKPAPIISGLPGNSTGTETAASTYDPIGRRYYFGVRHSL